jgi:hypothetical protein
MRSNKLSGTPAPLLLTRFVDAIGQAAVMKQPRERTRSKG